MAEKDASEKILESYNDVFSDIVNVLLFNGKQVLGADELEDQAPRTYYKADGRLHEIERDVAKRWKNGNIRVACIGFENQTASDPDMPLRVIGYDGAEYRAQLLGDNDTGSRYPVVTLVLYFGHEKPWSGPLSLKERLNVPKEFEPYVNEYKINLFQIAYLTHEQVELFQSDFKVVADYFVQKRESGDYIPSSQDLTHVQETLQLLSIMTNDNRFEEAYNTNTDGQKGGPRNMCDVLDKVESRGIAKGIAKGVAKGKAEGEIEGKNQMALLVKKLLDQGRIDDVKRASEDEVYRDQLIKEFGIR